MAADKSSDATAPPSWVVDLKSPPRPKQKSTTVANPPGFSSKRTVSTSNNNNNTSSSSNNAAAAAAGGASSASTSSTTRKPPTSSEMDSLKLKKSWELALGPAKQLPMNAIMMYMSGNSLQIFSIMMVFMLFKTPLQGLVATNETFRRYETEGTKGKMLGVKACYVLMQLLALGLGVWKVNGMGLLPTTRSDWLAWEGERSWSDRAVFTFR